MITRAWRPFALATLVLTCILPAGQALAERITFRIAGWNMESGESSDDHLSRQIGEKNGIDLWGFSEVRNRQAAEAFSQRAAIGEGGAEYDLILGEGGGADRLAIVYNKRRLQLASARELSDQVFERHRPPLVAQFREVASNIEFKFVVNHLARGDVQARLRQAEFLNRWVSAERMPVIAVGDYNFDWHVDLGDAGQRDAGFDAMVKEKRWIWLRPEKLVKTQADDSFVSMLDFVFVANPLPSISAKSTILDRDGDAQAIDLDFNDNAAETDHRPVDAVFSLDTSPRPEDAVDADADTTEAGGPAGAAGRAELLRRLDAIEAQLQELRALLR